MVGFAASVFMAIRRSRQPDEHAAWLRLSMFPAFAFGIEMSTTSAIMVSIPIFVLVILFVGYRIGKLHHPMIIASCVTTVVMISTAYVGSLKWYQALVISLMKPMVPWPEAS